ncbi:polysaccharide pyruvyl transferase family protein [Halobacillus sp. A5]|uniref:polysaccharide pyruvyl transferase family protein n=1 Tax=Halobacillus sp. A5 TaxID=2880263 RepID=UPI0020A64676|nr:polysaccharide pyruvyl transferase family protein [Halobacillus sp. A5]MCP3028414.1 polysaccharide pyruvyl transferase family protein [Halobacillus sp. A5]
MPYLILSTFGYTGSRNSGDDLISKSLIRLLTRVKGKQAGFDVFSLVDHSIKDIRDIEKYHAVIAPAMRPTVQGSRTLPPARAMILEMAIKHNIPFYAVGSGWGTYPGSLKQAKNQRLTKEEKAQLTAITGDNGSVSCRDFMTEVLLKNNGIPCYGTTGDCALFDTKSIGRPLNIPKKIQSIAVSLPHNQHHWPACYQLALQLKREFACTVYLTFHGYYGKLSSLIDPEWDTNEVQIKDLSGGAEKLSFYQKVDVHIGFRLHGHIWFLRKRKPSLLIAEDGRGMGHLITVNGLGYSAASKATWEKAGECITFSKETMYKHKENEPNIVKAIEMFKQENARGYPITKNSLRKIDNLWHNQMKPLIQQLP